MNWDQLSKQSVTSDRCSQYHPLAIAELRKEYSIATCDQVVIDAFGRSEQVCEQCEPPIADGEAA
jgi:hypothetical protein